MYIQRIFLETGNGCLKLFPPSQKIYTYYDVIDTSQWPSSAEGWVEHQKHNQTTPFGWVSSVQLGLRQMAVPEQCLLDHDHNQLYAISEKSFKQAFPVSKEFLYIYPKEC